MKKIYYLGTVLLTLLLVGATVSTTAQTALVQPNSTGITWVLETTHNIVWTLDSPQIVDIYLSTAQQLSGATSWQLFNNVASVTTSQEWTIIPSVGGVYTEGDYFIVITTSTGSAILAASINAFELSLTYPPGTGEIHVEQPNVTGIQWEPGTQHGIYWTDDLVEPVKLELWKYTGVATNDGYEKYTDQETGLPTSVEGTGYIWTLGADIDHYNRYKIRVASTTTDVEDFGDNDFTITDEFFGGTYIDLIQPNTAGIQWINETTHLISWMDDLIENVDIELWNAAGDTYVADIEDDVAGTTTDWLIPVTGTIPPANYTIKVISSNVNNLGVFDIGLPFAISNVPSGGTTITLIQPEEAGIQWLSEGTYVISWMDDLIENVDIELWNAAGDTYVADIEDDVAGTTTDWIIPEAGAGMGQLPVGFYTIRVVSSVNTSIDDISTNSFEITTTPHGGETIEVIQPDIAGIEWELGTEHLISWMDDLIEPVRIKLYNDTQSLDVAPGDSDIPDVDRTGTTWTWDIPDAYAGNLIAGDKFKIIISSSASGSGVTPGESEFGFDIIDYSPYGEVIMIQPNGGEEWLPGGTYLISWTDNISENVKIELSEDDGANYNQVLAASVPSSTWAWNTTTNPPAGSPLGTDYKIKISSVNASSSATDESELKFSFVNTLGGEVWVIQPDGGEVWVDETEYLISWMDELVENVYVKLLKGGDDPVADLVPWVLTGLPANAYTGIGIPGTTLTWDIPKSGGNCEDFDALTVSGVYDVADQLGGNWDTWNGATGTAEDAKVSVAHSVSPNNSILVDGTTDLVLMFDAANLTTGLYSFTNDIYIPTGKTGYWSLQNDVGLTASANEVGFEITYNGTSMVINISNTTLTRPYSSDTWYHNEIVVDLDNDWCYFYIDGVLITYFPWSPGINGSGANTLGAARFSAAGATPEAYFDNVCFSGNGGGGLFSGTDYKIIIGSIYDFSYNDISENTFTIATEQTGGTTIDIVQPDGGEEWALNTTHLISWDDDVFEDVAIELYDNQATPELIKEIADNVEGTTYEWNIDDEEFGVGTYRVRIYSTEDSNLEDYSEDFFTITGVKSGQSNFTLASGNGELVIYPNPTSTQFTIAAPGSIDRVVVRNMLGQVLYTSIVDAGQTVIDVSSYDAGIYIVNIIVEGEVVTKKLFVQ